MSGRLSLVVLGVILGLGLLVWVGIPRVNQMRATALESEESAREQSVSVSFLESQRSLSRSIARKQIDRSLMPEFELKIKHGTPEERRLAMGTLMAYTKIYPKEAAPLCAYVVEHEKDPALLNSAIAAAQLLPDPELQMIEQALRLRRDGNAEERIKLMRQKAEEYRARMAHLKKLAEQEKKP